MRGLVALIGSMLLSAPALACIVVPARVVVPGEVPVDGVVPIANCSDQAACDTLEPVVVRELATGLTVAGRSARSPTSAATAYWKPDAPLQRDVSYRVSFPAASGEPAVDFKGVDPSTFDPRGVQAKATIGVVLVPGTGTICCPVSLCGGGQCIGDRVTHRVELSVLVAPPPEASQWMYSVDFETQTNVLPRAPLWAFQGYRASHRFDASPGMYCYYVDATPLMGGTPVRVSSQCFKDEFADVGERARRPEDVAELYATFCPEQAVDAGVSIVDAGVSIVDAGTSEGAADASRSIGDASDAGTPAAQAKRSQDGCHLWAPDSAPDSLLTGLALLGLAAAGRKRKRS